MEYANDTPEVRDLCLEDGEVIIYDTDNEDAWIQSALSFELASCQ